MSAKPSDPLAARQSRPVDSSTADLSRDVDSALALLRDAVQDCGYTIDALVKAMCRKKRDRSLISRVLNGERPLTLDFVVDLPKDVEARYYKLRAEALGLLVVEPVDEATAEKYFAIALLSRFSPKPIKAALTVARKVAAQ